ncbi:hypothetical protein [Prochlorothrix hollandica]|uniref:hypothetical protein n=1 Tax=Prochlorothrix hollandica TaxID=1223 RepID=UPI00036DD2EE|nr:hypothetical protein [Prochlorothrix hollandica]
MSTGIVLIPTFALLTAVQRRSPWGYGAALASGGGVAAYSLYCGWALGAPLAFLQVQQAWGEPPRFWGEHWWNLGLKIILGRPNWKAGTLVDPSYPLIFLALMGLAYGLWRWRSALGQPLWDGGLFLWVVALWLLGGDDLLTLTLVAGGGLLFWHTRHSLNPTAWVYGCGGLLLILATGRTYSVNRLVFGIVSLTPALAVLLQRHPPYRYGTLAFFVLLLITHSIRFAQNLWVT